MAGACSVQVAAETELACTAVGTIPAPHAARATAPAITILLAFMLASDADGRRRRTGGPPGPAAAGQLGLGKRRVHVRQMFDAQAVATVYTAPSRLPPRSPARPRTPVSRRRSIWTPVPGRQGSAPQAKESGGQKAWPSIMTWCTDEGAANTRQTIIGV